MHVVHVASGLEWRGAERQLRLLARGLARQGVPQTVVTGRDSTLARHLAADGVALHAVPWAAPLDPRALPALVRETHRAGAVVHTHDAHALALVAAAEALGGAPVVATRRLLRPRRAETLWRRADAVVATSEAVRARLLRRDFDSTRIVVIPPGVAAGELRRADGAGVRAALGLPPEGPLAVALGGYAEEHGHALLLRAAERLAIVAPRLHWVLAGDGAGRRTLAREAAALGLADRVRVIPAPEEPAMLLAAASLFVLASWHEDYDPALLDAMALGVPVVATRTPTHVELVGDAAGLLVPRDEPATLADAVHRLILEPAFAEVLVRAASARVAHFDLGRLVAAHLSVYRSLGSVPDGPVPDRAREGA
ncbi:MAG TPA: glycosyltransferase [Gemmatimonadales bacterium]|nr:glycosyltransferase [Gemmatimonadales bacterium]